MSRTILVVMAHPDDCELTCGGSVVRWTRAGDQAILVIATDGARGGKERGSIADTIAKTRAVEQEQAASLLGFSELTYLGFPDGELADDHALRGALVEQIRRFRPDVAIVMDPFHVIQRNAYINHRDHRILGMAMLDALYPEASNAGYFPEQLDAGLLPHKTPELLLANPGEPNFWVDVSETLAVRFEALRCHGSQIRLWPENGEAVIRRQTELAAALGAEHGATHIEEFRRIVVDPLS